MFSEEALRELFSTKNIDLFKVDMNNENNIFELIEMDAIDFSEFVKKKGIDSVFYSYGFFDEDCLKITDDVLYECHIKFDIIGGLTFIIDDYNKKVSELDFNEPVCLNLYCVFNGVIFKVTEYNFWFTEYGFELPQTKLMQILDENLEGAERTAKELSKNRELARKELKEKIFNDEEFHKCTNNSMRRGYINKLLKNEEYYKLFYRKNGAVYDILESNFIEDIWREYKATIKKKS